MLGMILIVGASTAHASDVWSDVATGVRWLHRSTAGETPQDIHVVEVDLQAPGVSIQASSSETGTQRGVTTSTFAQSIGAVAAINGDWSYDTQTPLGWPSATAASGASTSTTPTSAVPGDTSRAMPSAAARQRFSSPSPQRGGSPRPIQPSRPIGTSMRWVEMA